MSYSEKSQKVWAFFIIPSSLSLLDFLKNISPSEHFYPLFTGTITKHKSLDKIFSVYVENMAMYPYHLQGIIHTA